MVDAETIAREEAIPLRFLLKIFRSLIKAKLVEAVRGAKGGYRLARPPDKITLLDVIQAVEGPIEINRCLVDPEYCSKKWANFCPVHETLSTVQKVVNELLDSVSLAELLHKSRRDTQDAQEFI